MTIAATDSVTFTVGQGVSFWLGPDGIGQVEHLCRRNLDVIYKRNGRLCRRRVSAHSLAVWQDTRRLMFPLNNPFNRAIVRAASKTFELDLTKSPAMPRRKGL